MGATMVRKYNFVVILITLTANIDADNSNAHNQLKEMNMMLERSEEELSKLSDIETKTKEILIAIEKIHDEPAMNRKFNEVHKKVHDITKTQLDILEQKLPERLEKYIEKSLSTLEKRNHVMKTNIQENINDNKNKLEMLNNKLLDMIHKMEVQVWEKENSLEKVLVTKINDLEKKLDEKPDMNTVNNKFDAIKNLLQLESYSTMKTTIPVEEYLNDTIDIVEKMKQDLENKTTINFDNLDISITNLQDNLKQKMIELNKTIPNKEQNDEEKNISNKFRKNINLKLDVMEKSINEINETIIHKLDTLEKKFGQKIDKKLDEIQKEIPVLKENMSFKMDALQELENDIIEEMHQTRYGLNCKEERVTGGLYLTPYHRMDETTLKHVVFSNDSTGTSFDIYLVVKGNDSVHLLLSPDTATNVKLDHDVAFEIEIRRHHTNLLKTRKVVKNVEIELLTATRFTALQVKVNNGKLEMMKEGNASPVFSYSDPGLKSVNHFSFGSTKEGVATIFYDCPSNVFFKT